MKLGKKPPRFDRRTLLFSRYLRVDKLPPLPTSLSPDRVTDWPVDGNDNKGDCVLASSEHIIRKWYTYADVPSKVNAISEQAVIDLYDQLSPNDNGLDILTILNRWRQQGLWGDKILGYAQLTPGNKLEAQYAAWLGALKMGLSLPDINKFGPWETPTGSPNHNNGHDVPGVGYSASGLWTPTWGSLVHMSWAWYARYNDESYIVWSEDEMNVIDHLYPGGFAFDEWLSDIAAVTGQPSPPPQPTPSGCNSLARIFHA